MAETEYTIDGNKISWKGELVRETSFSRESIGEWFNEMEYFPWSNGGDGGWIDWSFGQDAEANDDGVEIGLRFDRKTKTVTDYDGVFELPEPAVKLLESLGFDCSEVVDS